MRILLDTHLLLWFVVEPERFPANAYAEILSSDVFVSVASIWEIAIKYSLGKFEFNPRLILDGIEPAGFSLLTVKPEHVMRVAELPIFHKDPFDRMLVAQAQAETITLMTNDKLLGNYGQFVQVV